MARNNTTQGGKHTPTKIQRIYETKSLLFQKINKIDKLLSKSMKGQREKIQINEITDEKGDITTDTKGIQKTKVTYFKRFYSTKLKRKTKAIDKFLHM